MLVYVLLLRQFRAKQSKWITPRTCHMLGVAQKKGGKEFANVAFSLLLCFPTFNSRCFVCIIKSIQCLYCTCIIFSYFLIYTYIYIYINIYTYIYIHIYIYTYKQICICTHIMSIYLCIYSIAKLLICESTLNTTTKSYTIFATLLNTAASLVGRKKHGTKHSSDLCYPQWRPAMAHNSGNRQSVPAIAPCNGTQERHTAMAPHHGAQQWRVPWVPRPIRQSGLSPFVLLEVRTPKPKAIWGKSVLHVLATSNPLQ